MVHIDGAFGLWVAACSSLNHLTDGLELAQSWSVDGHKTLNIPYDSGISLCADDEAMVQVLQNSGAYIMFSEQRDGMLYTPEMSRRARAIDLWATLKYLGRSGVDGLVQSLHDQARFCAAALQTAGFEVLNEVVFNQVVFNQVLIRVGDQDVTDRFLTSVQQSGEAWLGGSQWFDKPVVRISVCSWATEESDIDRLIAALVAARASLSEPL